MKFPFQSGTGSTICSLDNDSNSILVTPSSCNKGDSYTKRGCTLSEIRQADACLRMSYTMLGNNISGGNHDC